MSFDRPDPDDKQVTDTEQNEAPEDDAVRRPPKEQDVTGGEQGDPVEPPD
ncbi:hypothetical protein ACWCOV_37140 [Kribbella sp. NPDC002412]